MAASTASRVTSWNATLCVGPRSARMRSRHQAMNSPSRSGSVAIQNSAPSSPDSAADSASCTIFRTASCPRSVHTQGGEGSSPGRFAQNAFDASFPCRLRLSGSVCTCPPVASTLHPEPR